jgi:hypothetical protein
MLRINHMLLLLILLASTMDSQIITFWLRSVLPAPPQDHEPTISSTISLPICKPISISPTSYRNSPMGPPTFISFLQQFCPPWGTHFTLGHPFLYLYIFSKKKKKKKKKILLFIIYYLLYKHSVSTFFVVTVGDFPFWPYATHVALGLEQYLSLTLADIVHIFRVPSWSVTPTL